MSRLFNSQKNLHSTSIPSTRSSGQEPSESTHVLIPIHLSKQCSTSSQNILYFSGPMFFMVVDHEQYVHLLMINFFLFIARDLTYHLVHVNTPPLSHTLVLSVNAVSLLVSELICVIQDLGISTWHLFSLPMTIVMEILSILEHSQILPLWEGEEKSHTPTFIVCSRLLNKLWHLVQTFHRLCYALFSSYYLPTIICMTIP